MSSRHTPDTIKLQTVVRLNRRPWYMRLIRAPYTFVAAYGIGRGSLSRANRLAIALHLTWLIISQP